MQIFNDLKTFIQQFLKLTEKEYSALLAIANNKIVKKKEVCVANNERANSVLFAPKGYFRFYHHKDDGTEITSDFYFAPTFITSYTSFITDEPSFVNVQSMEETQVLEFSKSDLDILYNSYPNIERLGRLIAEMVAMNSEKHLFLLLNHSAEFRYRKLISEQPEYIQNIPLQYIASYLGITKESLSRIRKSVLD